MNVVLAARPGVASDYEGLLEFLYLTPVGIVKFRPDGTIEMANPVAAALLMPLTTDSNMRNLYNVMATTWPDLRERIEHCPTQSGQICDQMQLAVPDAARTLSVTINRIDSATLMAVVQDVTLMVEQDRRIRDEQERFRALLEHIRDYAIYMADLSGRIDGWNASLRRLGGWQPEDVTGAPIGMMFRRERTAHALDAALLEGARRDGTAEVEGWFVRKNGTSFWGSTVATVLPDREGKPQCFMLVTRDLTDRKHLEDRLIALATTDPLTGAANRRAGETMLQDLFGRWLHKGHVFSVMMIDCDHFKKVNDRWGHETGDEVLVSLVRICRSRLRGDDTIMRWGGEEFLLLLPETRRDTAAKLAERLRAELESACVMRDATKIVTTVSIGIAEVGAADSCADDVVRRADCLLYQAKRAGRNRVISG
jgi:diguanylate cyclase (GGDEF)-like protein/PAS domain S-box-containing protein